MSCDQTQQCLLYLWGEMTAAETQAFAQHLSECSLCDAEVKRLAPFVRSMQTIKPQELPQELVDRVTARLAHAVRRRSQSSWITPRRTLAVAASILLILGLAVMWRLILTPTQQLPGPGTGQVADTLTEEDYVGVLALVWVSESEQAEGASIDAEIADIAAGIEDLLQQVDQNLAPVDSDGKPNGARSPYRLSGLNV